MKPKRSPMKIPSVGLKVRVDKEMKAIKKASCRVIIISLQLYGNYGSGDNMYCDNFRAF